MCFAIIRIYLKKDLENLECLLYPVDLFKGKALVQEGTSAPLIQGNRVIECINSILVPPQIKKGPAVFDPALFLVRIQPEGLCIRIRCISGPSQYIEGISFVHPDLA